MSLKANFGSYKYGVETYLLSFLFIEVPVASGYVYVCWDISILPVSTLYLFDIGTVPTVWYLIYKNCTQNLSQVFS
jgi:hypothetical protein